VFARPLHIVIQVYDMLARSNRGALFGARARAGRLPYLRKLKAMHVGIRISTLSWVVALAAVSGAGCDALSSDGRGPDEVGSDLSALSNDDRGSKVDDEDRRSEQDLRDGKRKKVQPILDCVDDLPRGALRAHWGYQNPNQQVVRRKIGSRNTFSPRPADRGQPTLFQAGTYHDVFTTSIESEKRLVWSLEGTSASATSSAKRCVASGGAGAGAGNAAAGAGGSRAGTGGAGTGGAGTGGAGTGGAGTGGAGAGGAGTGGAGVGGAGTGGAGTSGSPACAACRKAKCSDYQALGFNPVEGCFTKIDPQFGAMPADPTFIQECTSLVSCAYSKKCGFGPVELGECFCGTSSIDSCFATAGAANGPCMAEYQQAARSTVLTDISLRTTDLAYPVGWAFFLLQCDTTACGSACKPQ
jgi:hypothetical protein